MKLIAGLGNPGLIYAQTRHNVGFSVVKTLARQYKIVLKKDPSVLAWLGRGAIEGYACILALPYTFMNLSGRSVAALVEKFGLSLKDLLIVCDDLNLDIGRIKIRAGGSCGGHRGLASIIEDLGAKDFGRLRIGIGRPVCCDTDPAEYVLSSFRRGQRKNIDAALARAYDCCRVWLTQGIEKSMNMFNTKEKK
jgi:PTH1 family peptidyl-tRNA hydrolase